MHSFLGMFIIINIKIFINIKIGKYNGIKKFIQTTIEHCRITS